MCRQHYAVALAGSPVDTRSRTTLVQWLHRLHNEVNVRTGKSELAYEAFLDEYMPNLDELQTVAATDSIDSRIIMLLVLTLVGAASGVGIGMWLFRKSRNVQPVGGQSNV